VAYLYEQPVHMWFFLNNIGCNIKILRFLPEAFSF
jgi:hypothetical protein